MLLSLPDTWNYSVRGLSSITPDGVDGVLTALKELERLGYLERNQQRESNGRMGRAEYVIYEMPRKKPCSESPCTEKPYTVNPDTDTPVTENPAQLSTNRTSTETINKREKKEIQHRYGSYENVLLSDTEYGKLRQEFPGDYQIGSWSRNMVHRFLCRLPPMYFRQHHRNTTIPEMSMWTTC